MSFGSFVLLPNITGTAEFLGVETCEGTNAMKGSHSSRNSGWSYGHRENYDGNNLGVIEFEASNSNSIYANFSTVQPNSLVFNYIIKY